MSWPRLPDLQRVRLGVLVAVLLAWNCSLAGAEEAIQRLTAEIVVAGNGTVSVTETVRVRAEGNVVRRGIFRDVSTTFEDGLGSVHRVGFRLLGVTRDGRPEPNFIERHADFVRIYAGEEDVLLSPGVYTYVFRYETDRQIRWFDERAELFWNVTGSSWNLPIEQASATFRLPAGAAPTAWDAYTGPLGARGKDLRGGIGPDGALSVATTHRLEPGEGLTVVAALPAGVVERPGASDEFRFFLYDHLHWIVGAAALFGVLAYYLFAWDKVGRDPEGGTIIPIFHPPKGISPALASYVRNWGLSGGRSYRAFTAAALSLAVRGLLVFDQEGTNLVLERTEVPADPSEGALPPNEAALLRWVEAQGGRAEISQAHSAAVQEMDRTFRNCVEAESGGRHFSHNLPYAIGGALLSVIGLGAIVLFGGFSEQDMSLLFGLVTFGILVGIFIVPAIASAIEKARSGSLMGGVFSLVLTAGAVIYFGAGLVPDLGGSEGLASTLRDHAFVFAVALAFPLVNGLFYYLLRAPTREGRPVMDQLEGLRMYLDTAESGRLNIADAPDLTTERFEALLPYAVALDVERPWANAFAAALARAHPGDSDTQYRPRWRRGGGSTSDLGRSIGSAVSGATSSMQSAMPRSSSGSSGFGGGSGGGGGGRGGGGW